MTTRFCAASKSAPGVACQRPSLFDPLAQLDPWIERCRCSDLFALYLRNRPIAVISATSLDLASLNQLLFRLRQRPLKITGMAMPW
jgi:hypothetical protein